MSEGDRGQSPGFSERLIGVFAQAFSFDEDDTDTRGWHEQVALDKFGDAIRAREDQFEDFRRTANQARLDQTYDQYLATTVLYALLAAGVGALVGYGLGAVLSYFDVFAQLSAPTLPDAVRAVVSPMAKNILGALLLMVLGALLFGAAVGGALYLLPSLAADSRDREIQHMLPTTLSFMYALSDGGMPLIDIIDKLADEEATLGETAKEFQAVQNHMAFFGKDLKSAFRASRSTTPNDELGGLFDDLVSLIDSGGELTPFLKAQVDEYQRRNRREQESHIESMEVIATGYTVVGVLFPLLLMVTMTIFAAIGSVASDPLYVIIYIGIPVVSGTFLIVVDGMTPDGTATSATLPLEDDAPPLARIRERLDGSIDDTATDGGVVDPYAAVGDRRTGHSGPLDARETELLEQLSDTLRRDRIRKTLGRPLEVIRRNPTYSMVVTLPVALLYMAVVGLAGIVPYSIGAMISTPWFVTTAGFVVPLLVIAIPISYYHERKYRANRRAESELPTVLSTLASTNATGSTLIESIELVAESSHGPLANELENVGRELQWNVSLDNALIRFSNRVRNQRVTRLFKLLIESSTASDRVTEVLKVAENDAKFAREMDEERLETMTIIMGIIIFGLLVFLGVTAALVVRLFPPFAAAAAASSGQEGAAVGTGAGSWTFNQSLYTMLFYHGILIQALFSGAVAGKFGHNNAWVGLKFSIAGILLSVVVFLVI